MQHPDRTEDVGVERCSQRVGGDVADRDEAAVGCALLDAGIVDQHIQFGDRGGRGVDGGIVGDVECDEAGTSRSAAARPFSGSRAPR